MTDIPATSYIDGGRTLFTVSINDPHVVISSTCEVLYGTDENNYCFKLVRNTLQQFSFQENPNLNKISDYSFYLCKNLIKADLSNCNKLTYIGKYAFGSCTSLSSVNLPEGLQKVMSYAFYND